MGKRLLPGQRLVAQGLQFLQQSPHAPQDRARLVFRRHVLEVDGPDDFAKQLRLPPEILELPIQRSTFPFTFPS